MKSYVYKCGDEQKEFKFLPKSIKTNNKTIIGFNLLSDEKLKEYYYYPAEYVTPILQSYQKLGEKIYIFNSETETFTITHNIIDLNQHEKEALIENKKWELIHLLDKMNREYIDGHYTKEQREAFITLRLRCESLENETNKTNTILALDTIENWIINIVTGYYYIKEDEIKSITAEVIDGTKEFTELDELRSGWDFEQFNVMDPGYEIRDIINLMYAPPVE